LTTYSREVAYFFSQKTCKKSNKNVLAILRFRPPLGKKRRVLRTIVVVCPATRTAGILA